VNKVSIVMPAHNAEAYIKEAIGSVLKQSYEFWELIVVDDCSKDNTGSIVEEFAAKDPRIRYYKLEKNKGVANARNVGINMAQGRYLAFLDSDDVWLPDKLTAQISFMERADSSFSFTSYEMIDGDGRPLGKRVEVKSMVYDYETLLRSNVIGCLTVVLDLAKVGEVRMPSVRHEDYATWLSILKKGHNAHGLPQVLALYRRTEDSLSGNKIKSAKWTWDIYRNVEGLSMLKSALLFIQYVGHGLKKHYLT